MLFILFQTVFWYFHLSVQFCVVQLCQLHFMYELIISHVFIHHLIFIHVFGLWRCTFYLCSDAPPAECSQGAPFICRMCWTVSSSVKQDVNSGRGGGGGKEGDKLGLAGQGEVGPERERGEPVSVIWTKEKKHKNRMVGSDFYCR